MNGDYKGKKRKSLWSSFGYATNGIIWAILRERNMKIHVICAVLVVLFGVYFQIKTWEWVVVILLIGGMLSLEMLNTAIEQLVNLVTMTPHPTAKVVKDVAAGAVFVYALTAALIGFIIFIPYIIRMLSLN